MPVSRRTYTKPKFARGKMKIVSGTPRGVTQQKVETFKIIPKFAKSPKSHFVRVYPTEAASSIISMLRRAGLSVEEKGCASKRSITVSRYLGVPLYDYIEKQPQYKWKGAVLNAFELVGKVEAQGVAHDHPHGYNFLVRGGKVSLADFRLAHRVTVNWGFPHDVSFVFRDDMGRLRSILRAVKRAMGNKKAFEFFNFQERCVQRLVSQYPMSRKAKRIMARLLLEWWGPHS